MKVEKAQVVEEFKIGEDILKEVVIKEKLKLIIPSFIR